MGMKYVENFKSGIFWYNMYQVYVKHAKPWAPEWTVPPIVPGIWMFHLFSSLFMEKGSLGKGLDAPELEMFR